MPRDIDERKKRKALRRLRRAAERAEAGLGPPLTDWERDFLEEVEARIETYGSAFADTSKGDPEAPLSALQDFKLKEIDKKARGKPRRGLGARKPMGKSSEPVETRSGETESAEPDASEEAPARGAAPPTPPARPKLRVIEGGRGD